MVRVAGTPGVAMPPPVPPPSESVLSCPIVLGGADSKRVWPGERPRSGLQATRAATSAVKLASLGIKSLLGKNRSTTWYLLGGGRALDHQRLPINTRSIRSANGLLVATLTAGSAMSVRIESPAVMTRLRRADSWKNASASSSTPQ